MTVFLVSGTLFQNCSHTEFHSDARSQDNPKLGGGGIDGKTVVYNSYGPCAPKSLDIVESISFAPDYSRAQITREACQELSTAKTVDLGKVIFTVADKSTFMYTGRVYTSQPFNDGTLSAPLATVQHPNLLSGYTLRPPWKAAGVDYPVGVPSGAVLQDPAFIALAGVTVDAVNHLITVNGNGVTLDSYDFSINGGWAVQVNGANVRIVNCFFAETAAQSQPPISMGQTASNLYVGYTTIDGGGAAATPVEGSLIAMSGQGLVTEYCWLKNAPSNIFDFGAQGVGGGGSLSVRFNLIENAGRASGGGGLYAAFNGGAYKNVTIVFNTSIQTPGGTGTQGWNMDSPAALTTEVGNNTMISTATGAASYLTSIGPNAGTGVLHDNYFDLTGAMGYAYPGTGAYGTYTDNFNMTNGQALSQP